MSCWMLSVSYTSHQLNLAIMHRLVQLCLPNKSVMMCATQGLVCDTACLIYVLQADPPDAVEPSTAPQPKLSWRERALLKKQQAEGS